MTFDPYTGESKKPLEAKIANPEDRNRAEQLIHGLLAQPNGQELVRIWKKMLVNSPVFMGGSDNASLNHALGVNRCIQKFVQIADTGPKVRPKEKETENE